ncbi:hypothetical protein BX285_6655 [Streptomyces sp. 1114.5]|uniref:hypothetical protein n=1 Tax=unclassified Streptomyces TaxID=2593676 RepID=UPI000BC70A22|nr:MULTISPECIES: hypothetical protein [unclassified Streptomyces]RKT09560.1 hypothetical protein BX285_6655 [Streptomyces sp. 1114.5]SOB88434.1 hypothetical protein SAMN06272789_6715 [Streptomyces sp. 1331.2]
MTPEQAVQVLDALLDEAMSAIRPPLRYWDGWPRSTEQTAGPDNHSLGHAVATRDRYVMTRVAPSKYGALLGVTERGWQALGYRITAVNPRQPAMFAATPAGYGVCVLIGAAGNITFQATVGPIPVIRDRDPFGPYVPEPTLPNGNLDIIPRYEDPFWSH